MNKWIRHQAVIILTFQMEELKFLEVESTQLVKFLKTNMLKI